MSLYTPSITNQQILDDQKQRWKTICLDYRIWENPTQMIETFNPSWQEIPFLQSNTSKMPHTQGIYMFILKPNNANLVNNQNRHILYIGQTKNLHKRFSQYFHYEHSDLPSDQLKRIMVLLWKEKLSFHFFETNNVTKEDLTTLEFDLIDMIIPPMNDRFRADSVKQYVKLYSPR